MLSAIVGFVLLPGAQIETLAVGGIQRQAIVVASSNPSRPAPLVFVFHGHGGNMRQAQRSFAIERRWPEAIVVYADGLPSKGKTDPEGKKQGWQQKATDNGGRDLAFFDALLKDVSAKYKVDKKRIYCTGHSNGGRFTYLLWAERGETFAAVAPSASPAIGLIRQFQPIPAFIVAGTEDQIVPFPSQEFSIDRVRRILKTDESKAKTDGYTHLEQGAGGIELGTYIFPGPHSIPQPAIDQIVLFFKRHSKQKPV